MVNEQLRRALGEWAQDSGCEPPLILDSASYDGSIVGITEDGRVVYDYDRMVEEYAADEECSFEEAIEWIDYNTLRALPYFGDKAPVIVHSAESVMAVYGDMPEEGAEAEGEAR